MYFRRKRYQVLPGRAADFTAFFEEQLLPLQRRHGARLVGRWATVDGSEIMALWAYADRDEYERVESAVRADPAHAAAMAAREDLGRMYEGSAEDFLLPTGKYDGQSVVRLAVSACLTNLAGQVLLVRTKWRQHSMELPGGQVDEGESPLAAVRREVREEAGVECEIDGVTGVYVNVSRTLLVLVLRGRAAGKPRPDGETTEAAFVDPTPGVLARLVAPPVMRRRILDAMRGPTVPLEVFRMRPEAIEERVGPGAPA